MTDQKTLNTQLNRTMTVTEQLNKNIKGKTEQGHQREQMMNN